MTTKEQRDEKAKAALLQRVMDIYAGVIGSFVDSDYSLSRPEHDGHELRRLSRIFTQMTGGQCDDDWLCGHWETPAKASDYLFSLGIGVSSPPAAEQGQAEERTYADGLLRAAEICRAKSKTCATFLGKIMTESCAEAIEQEAKK